MPKLSFKEMHLETSPTKCRPFCSCLNECIDDKSDVTVSAMASQITSIWTVCSSVCSGAHQRKSSQLRVTGLCGGNTPAYPFRHNTSKFRRVNRGWSKRIIHYSDVIMSAVALLNRLFRRKSEKKHQSSASLAFVSGCHRAHYDVTLIITINLIPTTIFQFPHLAHTQTYAHTHTHAHLTTTTKE